MLDNIVEAIEAVESLNEKLHTEELYSEGIILFEVETDGTQVAVKFMNQYVWSDENEERKWIEDNNDYEPLTPFLFKQASHILNAVYVTFINAKHSNDG